MEQRGVSRRGHGTEIQEARQADTGAAAGGRLRGQSASLALTTAGRQPLLRAALSSQSAHSWQVGRVQFVRLNSNRA